MARRSNRGQLRIAERVVISLDDSPRWEKFRCQRGLGEFTRYSAFDARTGAGRDRFDVETFEARTGRDVVNGEIGCAISHHEVITRFAAAQGADEDLLLVAEDDVVIAPEAGRIMDGLLRNSGPVDLVILYDVFNEVGTARFAGEASSTVHMSWLSRIVARRGRHVYRVGPYAGLAWGAALYVISRDAARRYVAWAAEQDGIAWAADEYQIWAEGAGLVPRILRPGIAATEGFSAIRGDSNAPASEKPPHEWMWSEERPIRSAVRLALRKLRRSGQATRRDISRRMRP